MRTIHSGNMGVTGHRVGAGGRPGEPERAPADSAPGVLVSYFCAALHETRCNFSATVKAPPATWPCPKCGQPAGLDKGAPPPPERYRAAKSGQEKSHLDYVRQRGRTEADGEALIQWALDRRRQAREQSLAPASQDAGAASRDAVITGSVASATRSPVLSGEIKLAGSVRCQPRHRSRAQRLRGQCPRKVPARL